MLTFEDNKPTYPAEDLLFTVQKLCGTLWDIFIPVYTVFYNSNSCFLYLTPEFWTDFLMYLTSSGEENPCSFFPTDTDDSAVQLLSMAANIK